MILLWEIYFATEKFYTLHLAKPPHLRYNNLNDLDYEYLKNNDETWYCKTCIQEILPFCNKKINQNIINLGNAGIDPNLKNLLCQLNNLSEKENIDNENLPNCIVAKSHGSTVRLTDLESFSGFLTS